MSDRRSSPTGTKPELGERGPQGGSSRTVRRRAERQEAALNAAERGPGRRRRRGGRSAGGRADPPSPAANLSSTTGSLANSQRAGPLSPTAGLGPNSPKTSQPVGMPRPSVLVYAAVARAAPLGSATGEAPPRVADSSKTPSASSTNPPGAAKTRLILRGAPLPTIAEDAAEPADEEAGCRAISLRAVAHYSKSAAQAKQSAADVVRIAAHRAFLLSCAGGRAREVEAALRLGAFLERSGTPERQLEGLARACEHGSLAVVRLVAEQLPPALAETPATPQDLRAHARWLLICALASACGGGTPEHLAAARWLAARFRVGRADLQAWGLSPLFAAVAAGHLEAVRWLVETFELDAAAVPLQDRLELLEAACVGGSAEHLRVAQWLAQRYAIAADAESAAGLRFVLWRACQAGHLDSVRWAYALGGHPAESDGASRGAPYVFSRGLVGGTPGHLDVALWMVRTLGDDFVQAPPLEGVRARAFVDACGWGHLEAARWLDGQADAVLRTRVRRQLAAQKAAALAAAAATTASDGAAATTASDGAAAPSCSLDAAVLLARLGDVGTRLFAGPSMADLAPNQPTATPADAAPAARARTFPLCDVDSEDEHLPGWMTDHRALVAASANGRVEVVRWLTAQHSFGLASVGAARRAAQAGGHGAVDAWLAGAMDNWRW